MTISLKDPKLYKFNITDPLLIEFRNDQYKDGYIEVELSECGAIRYQMAKYRLENAGSNVPEIKVKSPTGKIKIFINPRSMGTGVQYQCGDLRIRILHNSPK